MVLLCIVQSKFDSQSIIVQNFLLSLVNDPYPYYVFVSLLQESVNKREKKKHRGQKDKASSQSAHMDSVAVSGNSTVTFCHDRMSNSQALYIYIFIFFCSIFKEVLEYRELMNYNDMSLCHGLTIVTRFSEEGRSTAF